MSRLYISNKNESVRMFKSDFVEWFSHIHPATPLVLYLPVVSYMLYLSVTWSRLGVLTIFGMFVVGLLFWTITEYTLHRFVFHYRPSSAWGARLHFLMHGVHHDYPNDGTRLVMAPAVSIPLAFLFYWLFGMLFGPALRPPTFAGLVAGYIFYDTLHYATHHFPMKRGIWKWLKQHHMKHHYQDNDQGYGVSTPLWDFAFRTKRR